jgi:hypothetical protein
MNTPQLADGTYLYQDGKFLPITMTDGYWVAEKVIHRTELVSGMVVGVWTDSETGTVWFDKTRLVRNLPRATALATLWQQIAIWDNANQREVRIG